MLLKTTDFREAKRFMINSKKKYLKSKRPQKIQNLKKL